MANTLDNPACPGLLVKIGSKKANGVRPSDTGLATQLATQLTTQLTTTTTRSLTAIKSLTRESLAQVKQVLIVWVEFKRQTTAVANERHHFKRAAFTEHFQGSLLFDFCNFVEVDGSVSQLDADPWQSASLLKKKNYSINQTNTEMHNGCLHYSCKLKGNC